MQTTKQNFEKKLLKLYDKYFIQKNHVQNSFISKK